MNLSITCFTGADLMLRGGLYVRVRRVCISPDLTGFSWNHLSLGGETAHVLRTADLSDGRAADQKEAEMSIEGLGL